MRKPFQGVINVIRFNWHFYVIAFLFLLGSIIVLPNLTSFFKSIFSVIIGLSIITIIISTIVTYYIYDSSSLYDLDWISSKKNTDKIVNITAGFDESSELIHNVLPASDLTVLDFYDPIKHTEISIKRARTAYPPYQNTLEIESSKIPLEINSTDLVISFLSAHEIRDETERVIFFNEQKRILKPNGEIIVIEHLRDFANFFAYTIGFMHFHSRSTWLLTFKKAGLTLKTEEKITPFITKFTLVDGNPD